MRRDTFVTVRLSEPEAAHLEALRAVLGCNRSEALRVLLRGNNAGRQYGNRMLPPPKNKNEGSAVRLDNCGATPLQIGA